MISRGIWRIVTGSLVYIKVGVRIRRPVSGFLGYLEDSNMISRVIGGYVRIPKVSGGQSQDFYGILRIV
jgi:hypothetical protein